MRAVVRSRVVPVLVVALGSSLGLSACSLLPKDPPSHASRAAFCAAYAGASALVAHKPGQPIARWTDARADMLRIHTMGTPSGTDRDAREAILRLSDIAYNAKSEPEARAQVDAFAKNDHGAQLRTMTAYFTPYCAAAG